MKPKRSTMDWVLEAVCLLALVAVFVIVATHWSKIPRPRVPRFRPPGAPTPWSTKNALWILMAINTGTYVLLTAAGYYQKLLNIPAEIDRDSPQVRQLLFSMTLVLKTAMMLFSVYLTWAMVSIGLGRGRVLSPRFLTVFVLAIPVPLILYAGKLLRHRK